MNQKKQLPKLRFIEFSEEWDIKKGSDLFISRREKGNENVPIYSVTLDRGLVTRKSLDRTNQNDAKPEDNLLVYPMDIVYNMMRMWQGATGISYQMCMVSPAYVVLKPKENVLSEFYIRLIKSSKYLYFLNAFSYGLTSDRLRLYYKDFSSIKFPFTSIQEQTKIVDFFISIDTRITYLSNKKILLEKYKKGVMQKIFSQEIRFKDDNGNDYPDWEEKKLGNLLDYEQPTKYLVNSSDYNDLYSTPVLTAGKTFILGYTNETEGIFKNNLPVIIFDDFTTANKFVDFPFKAKSSAMKILKANNNNNVKYIFEFMQLLNFSSGDEHKRYWISEYQHLSLLIASIQEQEKIAKFSIAIDKKIELVNTQLEETKIWQQGLLQQMVI